MLRSDLVFCRTWVTVEPKKLCLPVDDHLAPAAEPWRGMRRTAEVRRDEGLAIPVNQDSLYKVGRPRRHPSPLLAPSLAPWPCLCA